MTPEPSTTPTQLRGVEHAGVIDLLIHDEKQDEVALVMLEPRAWDGSELRLFQLQEKINAYLSFILDGEMAETYPTLMGKPLRLQLDCVTPPDSEALRFLGVVRDQIAFQGITLEVRVSGEGGCGEGCGCHPEA
ncbi:MAG TPA: DUF6572 domain-containing protein [Chthoniobacteraceae bacterium]